MSTEGNQLSNESNDRKYFVQLPQIIWAICRTPQDFILWFIVKMVAGEGGECILSTEDLAALCMMSAGKVSDSRKYLLSVGAMEGECRKDPGYPQPVWHLRIPDVWEENIRWRKNINGLKERVDFKRYLAQRFQEVGMLRVFGDESIEQLHVKSLHNMKPSQYEGSEPSYCEGGIPQNEGKNNHDSWTDKNKEDSIHESGDFTESEVGTGDTRPTEEESKSNSALPLDIPDLTSPPNDLPPLDPDVAECSIFYANNIHAVTQYVSDAIKAYLGECPKSWLVEAFEIAVENNVRKLVYIKGILDRSIALGKSPREAGPPESNRNEHSLKPNDKAHSLLQFPSTPELLVPAIKKVSKVEQVWLDTLAQLRGQMTKSTFDSMFHRSELTKPNGKYVVWVETKAQEEWVSKRLYRQVEGALTLVVGKPVKVEIHTREVSA